MYMFKPITDMKYTLTIEGFKQPFQVPGHICMPNSAQTERDRIHEHLLKFHRRYVVSSRMQRMITDGKYTLTQPK